MSGPTEDAPKQAGLAKADHGTKTGLWRNRGAQAGWRGHESWRRARISKVKLGMGRGAEAGFSMAKLGMGRGTQAGLSTRRLHRVPHCRPCQAHDPMIRPITTRQK